MRSIGDGDARNGVPDLVHNRAGDNEALLGAEVNGDRVWRYRDCALLRLERQAGLARDCSVRAGGEALDLVLSLSVGHAEEAACIDPNTLDRIVVLIADDAGDEVHGRAGDGELVALRVGRVAAEVGDL